MLKVHCVSINQVGDLDGVSDSWLLPGPDPMTVGIQGVCQ